MVTEFLRHLLHRASACAMGARGLWAVVLGGWLMVGPAVALGASVAAVSVDEMLANAELIFEGQVLAREPRLGPTGRRVQTCVLFSVRDVVKGSLNDNTLELCFLGGTLGGRRTQVADMRYPRDGERGIYFVESLTRAQVHPLYGWSQGHFPVANDPATGRGHVMTADGRPVAALEPGGGPPAALSTGRAQGVIPARGADPALGMRPEAFKQALRRRLRELGPR